MCRDEALSIWKSSLELIQITIHEPAAISTDNQSRYGERGGIVSRKSTRTTNRSGAAEADRRSPHFKAGVPTRSDHHQVGGITPQQR